MPQESIDIIIPTYEPDPQLLRETLDSLLRQTEHCWTCLIHDDASQENVYAIIEPYLRDRRFRFLRSTRHLGIGGNWNAALRCTKAPIVQYLFQDDTWYPTYLAHAYGILQQEPSVGFVATEHEYLCEKGIETARGYSRLLEQKKRRLTPGRQCGREFLRHWLRTGLQPNLIGEPSFVMMRRSVMEQAGLFSEEMVQLIDTDEWARLLRITDWYYAAESRGTFRVHRGAASFRHHERGDALGEIFQCLQNLRKIFPYGTPEHSLVIRYLDHHLTDIVGHIVNRLLRCRSIGKGAWPTIRYLRKNPPATLRALGRYAMQATQRWLRKVLG